MVKGYGVSSVSKEHKPSHWKKLNYYSVDLLTSIDEKRFKDALLLYGSMYDSDDKFEVSSLAQPLSGVEVIANALMTHFYFDGELKQLNVYASSAFVFVAFLLLFWLTDGVLKQSPKGFKIFLVNRGVHKLMVSLALTALVMGLFSWWILVEYRLWFNWFVPVLLFELVGVIVFFNKYIVEKRGNR